jgi:polysaccharide export outer membrane protein
MPLERRYCYSINGLGEYAAPAMSLDMSIGESRVSIGIIPHCVRTLALALVVFLPISSPAAAAPAADVPGNVAAQALAESHRLVQLGAGDSVTLSVFGQPDMATTTFVADDGTLTIPLAGPVQVAGLSPSEASQRIEKALRDGKYLVDPHVTISAIVSRSQRVSVIGEVGHPGRFVIESNIDILDLLAEAGGVTENAADVVYLLRPDKDGNVIRSEISLKAMAQGVRTGAAQTIKGGDSIYVPRAEQFYIYGEVSTPGKFRVEPGMTVIQAIARAGGLTPRGSQRRVEIKRLQSDGSYTTSSAKLDEPVRSDDVIRVKESIF